MKRRLFNIASALSLLLCVPTALLWTRSYWSTDLVGWETRATDGRIWHGRTYTAIVRKGVFAVCINNYSARFEPAHLDSSEHRPAYTKPFHFLSMADDDVQHVIEWEFDNPPMTLGAADLPASGVGFACFRESSRHKADFDSHRRSRRSTVYLAVPAWCPMLFLLGSPVLRLLMKPKGSRIPTKLCTRCGYDLRATPDRCPECGTPIDKGLRQ
ncbi:MAG TPA: hypothetical protein VHP11_11280 [Tepidisphaeraceae bacterium]|nr:hypothetical protein [Tepidisphaeraceae bacterium]